MLARGPIPRKNRGVFRPQRRRRGVSKHSAGRMVGGRHIRAARRARPGCLCRYRYRMLALALLVSPGVPPIYRTSIPDDFPFCGGNIPREISERPKASPVTSSAINRADTTGIRRPVPVRSPRPCLSPISFSALHRSRRRPIPWRGSWLKITGHQRTDINAGSPTAVPATRRRAS